MKSYMVGVLLLLAVGCESTPVSSCSNVSNELAKLLGIPESSGHMRCLNFDPYTTVNSNLEPVFNPKTDIIFRLYTRNSPNKAHVLKWNSSASVENSGFNPAHPTRFTIHGWYGNGKSEMHRDIRKGYFAVGEFNIISVDWGVGADTINYISARNHVKAVGNIVSRMINTLVAAVGISLDSVTLIGHSLGAHVAGNAGRRLNGKINTIFGLDPAGPMFSLKDDDILKSSDAQYVEVLVTDVGSLGFDEPQGDANFYANGGRSQPGCHSQPHGLWENLMALFTPVIRNMIADYCDHMRACDLFVESLTSSVGFQATKCALHDKITENKCTSSGADATMGGEPSNHGRGVRGVYWLKTKSKFPFAS